MRIKVIPRRRFLGMLGLLGMAVPVVSLVGCSDDDGGGGDDGSRQPDGKVAAFKLSRRGQHACKACRQHARNKVFSSEAVANSHRAHAGCDCRIKRIWIAEADFNRYFAESEYYDRRNG